MNWTKERILEVLDKCAEEFTFPVLDNGYVYQAKTRMCVYRSKDDWAIVIEVFGFSPKAGEPYIQIYTFSSNLFNRNPSSNYVSEEAYEEYLSNNPYNESRFVYPIENDNCWDQDASEYIKKNGHCFLRRGVKVAIPKTDEYEGLEIELEEDRPLIFEFCRYLAAKYPDKVLCTEEERRISVTPEMEVLLKLDEWNHPDISCEELPSSSETFSLIAEAIVTGRRETYSVTSKSNTHWANWPEGGTL